MTPSRSWYVLLLFIASCTATKPYVADEFRDWETTQIPPDSELTYKVFLIGDAGGSPENDSSPGLKLLSEKLKGVGKDAAVIFLGDNLYCCGLPDSASENRAFSEGRLRAQMDVVKPFEGRVVFVPGNHDWNNAKDGGLAALARAEAYIESYLDRGNVMRPDNGFPGPDEIKLTDRVKLIVLDTEWWLTRFERGAGEYDDFDIEEEGDFLIALDEVIKNNNKDDLLIVGHHPIYSNGRHAGRFPPKSHLFPLTEKYKNAYIPLPVIGTLAQLYLRYVGSRQDLANRHYRSLTSALLRVFDGHESIIYASGHEHSLQYFSGAKQNFIVSGSGSKSTYAAPGGKADFTYAAQGFSTLNYYHDGSVWMTMWAVDEDHGEGSGENSAGKMVFRTQIKGPAREEVDPEIPTDDLLVYPDYTDSSYVTAANPGYQNGPVYEFFLGKHNRDVWALPVKVPYLDMGREAGGLTPVKRGGGMQTFSLRLKGTDGFEYVLRSIDKDPSVSVPLALRKTVVTGIVQDQIASIHPYGAFIIPKLADAIGVYHTTPKLVYVPDDPRLGVYRETFANQLMMFEIRPDGDMSASADFGYAEDIISPHKFYTEITEDNDHRPDYPAFVKARLFDMLLSDWDRHQLQWRWAAFEPEDNVGKIYRPIPRDRDWAFNQFNGLMPTIARLTFDKKFQDFDADYGKIEGLTLNGLSQDRRLLPSVSRETWLEMAAEIQAQLTDEVIEQAVLDWPDAVIDFHGQEVVEKLKARRDILHEAATSYYELIAKYVELVGSNKHERFMVSSPAKGELEVIVYKTSQEGEVSKELFRRVFYENETSEVRLFGLDGNDHFEISENASAGIKLRVVGGAGEDTFINHSSRRKGLKRTVYYDSNYQNHITDGTNSKVVLSDDPAVNVYDQKGFLHDDISPQVFFGSNKDDGLFIGGGVKLTKHGFRKTPYGREQRIVGNIAARTQAFNVEYSGRFVEAFGRMNVLLNANYRTPNNIHNFFGLGNETENTEAQAEFYQAQLSTGLIAPSVELAYEPGASITFGTHLRYTDVKNESDRFVGQQGISEESFEDQYFWGFQGGITLDLSGHPANPKQGFIWKNDVEVNFGVWNSDDIYSSLKSSLAFYLSPSLSPQVTFAMRAGVAHNRGDFPFYAANTVGGVETVRGWRNDRFAGRTSFYTNAEVRAKLFNFNSYVAVGDLGVLGFIDNGRVWTEADTQAGKVWHQGYGGGLWVSLFDSFVINSTIGFSEEENVFNLKIGFHY
ncbi:MAG: BamA/TamA family outer membrane protein [Rhodothermales bacterium]